MSDRSKVTPAHTSRAAFVYLRQSSPTQVLKNRESTDRQYGLVNSALDSGWSREQITVIDEDLGKSGKGDKERSGFERMAAEVALGRVGIVFGLEVSRVARSNAEWHRLLDLCGITDTLIADNDGVYHPRIFNDRMLLGLKGTMSEAELHTLRSRLDGGIRNKAARGELRRVLPIGLIWGEDEGEVRFHPDEEVIGAIRSVFDRFVEMGTVRKVWLWFRSSDLLFPLQSTRWPEIQWTPPTYTSIHHVLTNPAYAGAYAYGKTRNETYIDEDGKFRSRVRKLPRDEWQVLITDHHQGFIDWETYEANQARIASNTRPRQHQAGGAVREGSALLQGIATCGRCGRRLRVYYQGRTSSPGYHCPGATINNGRASYCLRVGGIQIHDSVVKAFLAALSPAGIEASLEAEALIGSDHDTALAQWRLSVERAQFEAEKAERRYRTVEPENRLVARSLETEWNQRLVDLKSASDELARREKLRPRSLTAEQRDTLQTMGADLERVWSAPTTTDRDRKQLLGTLLDEVIVDVNKEKHQIRLTMRWRGGAITELEIEQRRRKPPVRTDEDTIDLVRRLAVHHKDGIIASILNRQGRLSALGERFTASKVRSLRGHWKIPCCKQDPKTESGELVTIAKAAKILGVAPSTVHRWLNDGFIAGEQLTPTAPWRIRITDDFRSRLVEEVPDGWVPMFAAMKALGVSRQTIVDRVKRGELEAIYIRRGKAKGLRIRIPDPQPTLFDESV